MFANVVRIDLLRGRELRLSGNFRAFSDVCLELDDRLSFSNRQVLYCDLVKNISIRLYFREALDEFYKTENGSKTPVLSLFSIDATDSLHERFLSITYPKMKVTGAISYN